MTKPSRSEIREAPMNHAVALAPTRLTEAVSPIWAMPTTRVEKKAAR